MPNLVEIGPMVLCKKFLKNFFYAISLLSPIVKGCGPPFEHNWISFTQGCFVPSFFEIDQVILENKILFLHFCLCFYRYFAFFSSWKRVGPFVWTNLVESFSSKDALCQVWLKLAQWFLKRRFLNFRYFVIISHWNRTGPFIWKKKLELSSPKDASCQVWLKLD